MSVKPSEIKTRFDVVFKGDGGIGIAPHFCREWNEDGGCYGTNSNHGMSFEEACEHVAECLEEQAKAWRNYTHGECMYYLETEQ